MTNHKPTYTLKARVTPLPSQQPHPKQTEGAPSQGVRLKQNEDDDLYDPYTDFHDGNLGELKFEADPWN